MRRVDEKQLRERSTKKQMDGRRKVQEKKRRRLTEALREGVGYGSELVNYY